MKSPVLLYSIIICIVCSLLGAQTYASDFIDKDVTIPSKDIKLQGSLMVPSHAKRGMVVLIISGAGATDRNGNSRFTQSNCLYQLARSLAKKDITSLRYDKRGIGRSTYNLANESDLHFSDFIDDALSCIKYLQKRKKYKYIYVIGYSQGALVGAAACNRSDVSGYVSISGASKTGDQIIKEQLESLPQKQLRQEALNILEKLKKGEQSAEVPITLRSLFRPSIQPFLISWFNYNPIKEVEKITSPILILNGDKDLQNSINDAKHLQQANKLAEIKIIKGMNHVLKEVGDDIKLNHSSYNDPQRPISPTMVEEITSFIISTLK